jgi:hypothetical protein
MADLGLQGKRRPPPEGTAGGGKEMIAFEPATARAAQWLPEDGVDAAKQGSAQREEKGRGPDRLDGVDSRVSRLKPPRRSSLWR